MQEAAEADRRAAYAAELAGGADRFLEPRRATCPWCDAPRLAVRVRMPDLLQGKPGRFTLEECQACGHVFQNPRLTVEACLAACLGSAPSRTEVMYGLIGFLASISAQRA
ncbi:hypothetical protein ACM614_22460, partial [Streptomyces sp. 12297]